MEPQRKTDAEASEKPLTPNTGPGIPGPGASLSFIDSSFLKVLDALPYYVFLIDEHHHIVLANQATRTALKVEPEDIIGGYCPQVVHGLDHYEGCPVDEAVKKGRTVEHEVFNEKVGRWFKTTAYPTDCRSADGGRIYYHTIEDIHDSKMAGEALLRERNLSDSIVSNMPAGIAFLDNEFVIRKTNATFMDFIDKYSSRPVTPAIGQSFFRVIPGSRAQLEDWFCRVRDSGQAETRLDFELKIGRRGERRTTHWNASVTPVFDQHNEVDGIILLTKNLTEHRLLEEQLITAQKMESVGRLAGGVAHDFNNLLTAIQGYTEFALGKISQDTHLRTDLEEVLRASNRASDLTRQLLLFSRNDPVDSHPLDIKETVGNLQKMLNRIIGEKYTLVTDLPADLWTLLADPTHLEQVIMNLVVNARDAMPQGGDIVIQAENMTVTTDVDPLRPDARPGRFVCLSVTDTGMGMDLETQSRIFDPFFTTKGPTEGTGLGLSVVHGIIAQHKGWIDVSSEPEKGSRFMVCLPVAAAAAEKGVDDQVPDKQDLGRGERVLLVEDDDAVRRLIEKILRDQGYNLAVAGSAEEAREVFAGSKDGFDLLVSDIILPGENGVSLANRLRQINPGLAVILTSGYDGGPEGLSQARADGFLLLQKPFSRSRLLQVVEEILIRE
ncbi:MAG: hybrid sensor histidine kinase/response regulator [Thermoleophilia bacterium]